MNTLRNLTKSVFDHIFPKLKYFAKQFISTESPDQYNICSYFESLKFFGQKFFEAIVEPFRENCS